MEPRYEGEASPQVSKSWDAEKATDSLLRRYVYHYFLYTTKFFEKYWIELKIKRWMLIILMNFGNLQRWCTTGVACPAIFAYNGENPLKIHNEIKLQVTTANKKREETQIHVANHLCPGNFVEKADMLFLVYYSFDESSFRMIQHLYPAVLAANKNLER